MDIFDEELLRFWRCLNNAGVRYIMVGGVATNLNGYHRSTDDIDVWLEENPENRKRFRLAFEDYSGENYEMIERMQLVPGWVYFHLNNGFRLDLMTEMVGLEQLSFDTCLANASIAEIDDVKVPFLHLNHLIANKKAVNRPKDQIDVLYLERIQKILEEEKKANGS